MDFTREPIIETVITPREGFRLVVRSSKGAGYEEHFVEALEVVSFGSSVFFRCLERPKPFIVPVADYEVLEVREPRMVLKTPSEQGTKEKREKQRPEPQREPKAPAEPQPVAQEGQQEPRGERQGRRDRRRGFRRRRGQAREEVQETASTSIEEIVEERSEQPQELNAAGAEPKLPSGVPSSAPTISAILPPPTTLIRDDPQRLREKEEYKGAFYIPGEKEDDETMEELGFRQAPYDLSDEEIRMSEGGDLEVPQEDPFRPTQMDQEGHEQDVQKEVT